MSIISKCARPKVAQALTLHVHVHSIPRLAFRKKTNSVQEVSREFSITMDALGECSKFYNEGRSFDDNTVCEVEKNKRGLSFESLTAADIITLMNDYIESVESIVGVS